MQNTLYVKLPFSLLKKETESELPLIFEKYGKISKTRFTNVKDGMVAAFTYDDPRDYEDASKELKGRCAFQGQTLRITDTDPEITLENVDTEFWSFLLNSILTYSELEYVVAKKNGKKTIFRPHPNEWHGEGNPGKECEGYDKCDLPAPVEVEGPISYHIKKNEYDEIEKMGLEYLLEGTGKKNMEESRVKRFAQALLSVDVWSCRKTIIFLNEMDEPNDDHRGSDHTSIKLDWNKTFAVTPVNGKITFLQLAEALYRLKSHKFDYNYELFGWSGATKISELNNCITISVNFDYGS